jgi:hypothetical protein
MPILIPRVIAILLCFVLVQSQAAGKLQKSSPIHISCGSASLNVIADRHIINFTDSNPSSSLKERINALGCLLNTYFIDHPRDAGYVFTFGTYAELNNRMAASVSCSPKWNFKTGQMRNKHTANWLRKLLNNEQAYQELIPLFKTMGYRIEISSMESISLCRPEEIDWKNAPRSCKTPLSPQAKLPCGALLTFTLHLDR